MNGGAGENFQEGGDGQRDYFKLYATDLRFLNI